jgi:hypothetical protein
MDYFSHVLVMKVYSISIVKNKEIKSIVYNLESFSFLNRYAIKEFINFFSLLCVEKNLDTNCIVKTNNDEYCVYTYKKRNQITKTNNLKHSFNSNFYSRSCIKRKRSFNSNSFIIMKDLFEMKKTVTFTRNENGTVESIETNNIVLALLFITIFILPFTLIVFLYFTPLFVYVGLFIFGMMFVFKKHIEQVFQSFVDANDSKLVTKIQPIGQQRLEPEVRIKDEYNTLDRLNSTPRIPNDLYPWLH